MKILLAVDGSDYTRRMLDYLTTHQETLGSGHDYTVRTGFRMPTTPSGAPARRTRSR